MNGLKSDDNANAEQPRKRSRKSEDVAGGADFQGKEPHIGTKRGGRGKGGKKVRSTCTEDGNAAAEHRSVPAKHLSVPTEHLSVPAEHLSVPQFRPLPLPSGGHNLISKSATLPDAQPSTGAVTHDGLSREQPLLGATSEKDLDLTAYPPGPHQSSQDLPSPSPSSSSDSPGPSTQLVSQLPPPSRHLSAIQQIEVLLASMNQRQQAQALEVTAMAMGIKSVDFHKLHRVRDGVAYLQAITRSQVQPAVFQDPRIDRSGDILGYPKMEITTDTRAQLGDGKTFAGNVAAQCAKLRRILVDDVDYTTNTVTGYEIFTYNETGMENVHYKFRKRQHYHLKEESYRGGNMVRIAGGRWRMLNRTGNKSLTIKHAPRGTHWSDLSHVDSRARTSFRLHNFTGYFGSVDEKDMARFLRDRAVEATEHAAHAKKRYEDKILRSAAATTIVAAYSDDDSIGSVSGDEWEDDKTQRGRTVFTSQMLGRKRKRSTSSPAPGASSSETD